MLLGGIKKEHWPEVGQEHIANTKNTFLFKTADRTNVLQHIYPLVLNFVNRSGFTHCMLKWAMINISYIRNYRIRNSQNFD